MEEPTVPDNTRSEVPRQHPLAGSYSALFLKRATCSVLVRLGGTRLLVFSPSGLSKRDKKDLTDSLSVISEFRDRVRAEFTADIM